jgi:hypothetical protein
MGAISHPIVLSLAAPLHRQIAGRYRAQGVRCAIDRGLWSRGYRLVKGFYAPRHPTGVAAASRHARDLLRFANPDTLKRKRISR